MKLILDYLSHLNYFELFIIFLIENLLLFGLAIAIGKIVEYKKTVLPFQDIKWVVSTIICNTLITLIGFELYLQGFIEIKLESTIWTILLDLSILLIAMDFLMFLFHFGIHKMKFLYPIHAQHHTHVQTNIYSLFVLHPMEALGFGTMWLLLIILYNFNINAIIIYLFLNLSYGIIGHMNKNIFPIFWTKNPLTDLISTTIFHHNHHENEKHNFGFYFTIWDRIFKTNLKFKDNNSQ